MTSRYEEAYARLWHAQVKQEKNEAPRFRIISSQELNGDNAKGPLSKHAGLVNRMLLKGMTQADIAQITGKSQQSISQTLQRYGLPRPEEK